ncbi:unnamed protein product [Lymnaea stagnalis]|uniref:5'-nucleotidase domain-containing protein 1 n=1 Tax=Lymnaea stagnalis TaxID=6523 RepID=A0AAV2I0X3_LYMST
MAAVNFTDYDILGFDMDFTLARYKLVPFFNMVYDGICRFLVEEKHYDASIFHDLHEDKDLIYKGLIADFEKGNVLKLGHDGVILRATHGTKKLTMEEIEKVYGKNRIFGDYENFQNGLKSPDGKWRFFENYFDIPALVAFARIVDSIRKMDPGEERSTYVHIWAEIYEALEDMYKPTQCRANKGSFFPNMKAHTYKYIDKISPEIKDWLDALRQNDRKVFLLTSSFPDFATLVMEYAFGPAWKSYFDLIVYGGRKPKFFTESKPFLEVADTHIGLEVEELKEAGEYCHGNSTQLMEFFTRLTGKITPKVIYFGDNLWADAWPSKSLGGWNSVLVLEEMDAEGYVISDGTVKEQENTGGNSSLLDGKIRFEHSSLVTEEEIELMVSQFWGSIFIDEMRDNRTAEEKVMNTAFGDLISQYTDICVPSIEYLAGVPVTNAFTTFGTDRGSNKGFHPGCPKSLLS